jgi:F-type H+-transporting ATPase subunit a
VELVLASDETTAPARRSPRNAILIALAGVIVLDVLAAIFVPPFPKGGQPGQPIQFPADGITANLELPAPHVVLDLAPSASAEPAGIIQFHPSITSTILTSWIVIAIVLALAFLAARGLQMVPGRRQNLIEFAYESLENFGTSLGGPEAKRYIPIFAAFFTFILVSNWSGLVPPIGKLEELRAPTSDVNITIGLALVAFVYFEYQGFRNLGVRGYLVKFFPVGEFRHGLSAGLIAMFVGLIELMLEFVKPLTLSMRLFGNIFGGEVALGVMTALTVAVIPVALVGLEFLLNFVQALIFSVLTLMFTLAAVESHHSQDEPGHELDPHATPVADLDLELDGHHAPAAG